MKYADRADVIALRSRYKAEVWREDAGAAMAAGLSAGACSAAAGAGASRASQSMALPVGRKKRGAGSRWVAVMAVGA